MLRRSVWDPSQELCVCRGTLGCIGLESFSRQCYDGRTSIAARTSPATRREGREWLSIHLLTQAVWTGQLLSVRKADEGVLGSPLCSWFSHISLKGIHHFVSLQGISLKTWVDIDKWHYFLSVTRDPIAPGDIKGLIVWSPYCDLCANIAPAWGLCSASVFG